MAHKNTEPESENRKHDSGGWDAHTEKQPQVVCMGLGGGDASLLEKEKRLARFTFCRCRVTKKASLLYKTGAFLCVWKSPPKVKGVEKEGQRYRTRTFINYLEERLWHDWVSSSFVPKRSYFLRLLSQPALWWLTFGGLNWSRGMSVVHSLAWLGASFFCCILFPNTLASEWS